MYEYYEKYKSDVLDEETEIITKRDHYHYDKEGNGEVLHRFLDLFGDLRKIMSYKHSQYKWNPEQYKNCLKHLYKIDT